MDDILLFFAKSGEWDYEKFCQDFEESQCYHPPLTLTDGTPNTFLETRFHITTDNEIRFWLKNDNEYGKKVWRYQHYDSHAPFLQKRALLTACLKKVNAMASDRDTLYMSAMAKLREFHQLGYPYGMLVAACNFVGASMAERRWLDVRDALKANQLYG